MRFLRVIAVLQQRQERESCVKKNEDGDSEERKQ
jgi:hypothetical protein